MNRSWTRPIHRLAHRLDRLGWWLEDPSLARRKREAEAEYRKHLALKHADPSDGEAGA